MQLSGRIALITGASQGIGQAVAVRFAKEGAHVILVARTIKGLEATDDMIRAESGTATLVPLDLTEPKTIEALSVSVAERFGRLDVLVGNAGDGGVFSPVPHIEPPDWDKVMAVNVTANYHLIRCLHPLLMASEAGRAMFVTSRLARDLHPYWGGYAASKAALEALVLTYAGENVKTPLKINLINPGKVATRMYKQAFPGADTSAIPKPEDITDVFVKLANADLQGTGKVFEA